MNKFYLGDNPEILREMDANSVYLICPKLNEEGHVERSTGNVVRV